jgi:transcriptional regulator CtsR
MKYVVEERFTDNNGFTFEKANSGGYGKPISHLYIMRKDGSRDVFELIEAVQYEAAFRQYSKEFKSRLNKA